MSDDRREHDRFMTEALREAEKRKGRTGSNPAVGAVFVQDGVVVARGFHFRAGHPHAEIEALKDARARGIDVTRGTMYVTLEPCVHQGQTGPCTEALIAAGVRELCYGCEDPNGRAAGGARRLREAGVTVIGPVRGDACRALIADFCMSIEAKRPWVIVKAGISLDGRIATRAGQSQWITNEAARAAGRALRGQTQAIVAGIGTVLADDPQLSVRDGREDEPYRVIFDSQLRLPLQAKVLKTPGCVVVTGAQALTAREKRLRAAGARVLRTAGARPAPVQAARLLQKELGVIRLFIEGGPTLVGAFADADLIDELHLFLAPLIFGGDAPAFVAGKGVAKIASALRFKGPSVTHFGDDLHLHYLRDRAGK